MGFHPPALLLKVNALLIQTKFWFKQAESLLTGHWRIQARSTISGLFFSMPCAGELLAVRLVRGTWWLGNGIDTGGLFESTQHAPACLFFSNHHKAASVQCGEFPLTAYTLLKHRKENSGHKTGINGHVLPEAFTIPLQHHQFSHPLPPPNIEIFRQTCGVRLRLEAPLLPPTPLLLSCILPPLPVYVKCGGRTRSC